MSAPRVARGAVLRHRVRVQQLDRAPASTGDPRDVAVLDAGVQDTGSDGALWALALRGLDVRAGAWPDGLGVAWTLRGAPHAYRRTDLPRVERALRPWSDADAAKRVFDAARPLRAAGIDPRDAIAATARALRDVVDEPRRKGEVSTAMTARMPEPYLRRCGPCGTTHMYEQTFRLAALHGGLEIEPGTSPPILRRVTGWPADAVACTDAEEPGGPHDPVRQAVRFLGPTTPRDVAAFLDSPVREVSHRWPVDVVTVDVEGARVDVLADDLDALRSADGSADPVVRLLGPFDLFLQARDRTLLVRDSTRRTRLWPTLGRPGAVLRDGEVVGTWRPRARGRHLALELDPWERWDTATRAAVDAEHARLATFRGVTAA